MKKLPNGNVTLRKYREDVNPFFVGGLRQAKNKATELSTQIFDVAKQKPVRGTYYRGA